MIGCKQFGVNALPRSLFSIPTALVASTLTAAAALAQDTNSGMDSSFVRVEMFSALVLLASGIAIWIIARNQTNRIRELKREAEKLREADFGEPLRVRAGELGELAAVFNDMRDKLRATTISRDYVDSILASMNDAIIVTAEDGTIKRVNRATSYLLGYDEDELIGTSVDHIVDNQKSGSLVNQSPSGIPQEAYLQSKLGESIPVSYTCSPLQGKEAELGDRIYAAQNITERRRAEKRIRYLARIDALTKIPNRMQFQHLLQRCIARARRSSGPLCLFYVDIDAFKEIKRYVRAPGRRHDAGNRGGTPESDPARGHDYRQACGR
jgi:PAS domain S-box-containing protein